MNKNIRSNERISCFWSNNETERKHVCKHGKNIVCQRHWIYTENKSNQNKRSTREHKGDNWVQIECFLLHPWICRQYLPLKCSSNRRSLCYLTDNNLSARSFSYHEILGKIFRRKYSYNMKCDIFLRYSWVICMWCYVISFY